MRGEQIGQQRGAGGVAGGEGLRGVKAVVDMSREAEAAADADVQAGAPERVEAMRCDDIGLSHAKDAPAVLDGLSLTVPKGTIRVALDGNNIISTQVVFDEVDVDPVDTTVVESVIGQKIRNGIPLSRPPPNMWKSAVTRRKSLEAKSFERIEDSNGSVIIDAREAKSTKS